MLQKIHGGILPLYCIAVLITVLLVCPFTWAHETKENGAVEIIALGRETIKKDDLPGAKDKAVNQALAFAVEQAVTGILTRTDITANLELLYDKVILNAADYVITYRVLTEMKSRNRFLVAVESQVDARGLESFFTKLGILEREGDNPTLLLLIAEQVPGEILPRYWWGKNPLPYESASEQAAARLLETKGFHLIGIAPPRPVPEKLGVTFSYINNVDSAVEFARELKADIVVLGRAAAQPSSNVMGEERTYEAEITLEAFGVESGAMVASVKHSAAVTNTVGTIGYKNALTQVGTQAGEGLATVISRYWNNAQHGPQPIETRIEGTDYLSSFILLRRILNQMDGIDDIQTKELGSKQAVVDIVYQGGARKLADALMLKNFNSFGIEISDVADNSLTIRFVTENNTQPVKPFEIQDAYISE